MVGDLYIHVNGGDRLVHPSAKWLRAVAGVLDTLNIRASTVVSTVGVNFSQDEEEQARVDKLLDLVVKAKGGLSIVDLTS